jgi:hypothetical protein
MNVDIQDDYGEKVSIFGSGSEDHSEKKRSYDYVTNSDWLPRERERGREREREREREICLNLGRFRHFYRPRRPLGRVKV